MGQANRGRRGDRSVQAGGLRTTRRRRPSVDRLEDRTLLTITSDFTGGVLTVASDAGDPIVITQAAGNVLVNGEAPPSGIVVASDVTELDVVGGPDANRIDLSGVSTATFANLATVTISGGGGDDTIIGSALADVIDGGPGSDQIFGLGGDDTIQGGSGNDTIIGGQGDDTIFGDTEVVEPPTLIGLDAAGPALLSFSADAPGTILSTTPITGIGGTETIVGIDTRPANGLVYALTNDAGTGRIYTIDPSDGVATLVSTLAADPDDATDPYTGLLGTDFGVDFNPIPDRLRVVGVDDQNLRINVDTGLVITDGILAYAVGDVNEGADPAIAGAAYFNPIAGATTTTLYVIDTDLDILVRQAPPNDGTLNTIGELGVGDVTAVLGFDILPGSDLALASLVVGGAAGLYEIDLETGAATAVGDIGDGTILVGGLTLLGTGNPLETNNDTIIWNNGDGSDVIEGGTGTDTVLVNGRTTSDNFTITPVPGMESRLLVARSEPGPFSLDIGGVEVVEVDGRFGDDTFVVADLTPVADLEAVNLLGGEGNDAFAFLENGTVLAGRIDGGAGSDTISYDGYTTPVTIDLGTGREFFGADLGGDQVVPPAVTPASGTGTFTLNPEGTELAFTITFEGLQGSLLGSTGAQFHAPAGPGDTAAIVRSLTPAELGDLTSSSGTFSGVWTSTDLQPLTPELVEQLQNGLVYFNINTVGFPNGEIRGQILLTGTEGTAPGVAELLNVENAIGGSGDDTLIGSSMANSLVGGRGSDTVDGGAGNDTIIWNNGDGSDVFDGGAGNDTVQVNGAPAGDVFEVSAGAGGRLDFQRTNLVPFSLDIGTVEGLEVRAGLGEDLIVVNDLTGVADLERVDIDGEFENDVIDASALPAGLVALTLRGGAGNDSIVGSQGDDTIFGGQGNDTIIGGRGNDVIQAGPTAEEALFAAVRSDNTFLIFTADATGDVLEVPAVGLQEGESIVGIDFRPSEVQDVLYVLTDQGRIYTATPNGQLTLRSTLDQELSGTSFGADFNPVPDRLRIVSDARQNLRANVDTGETVVDGELTFAEGDVNAGATPDVVAAAYTNGFAGTTSTTLFTIDATLDALLTQIPPNAGTLNTIGALGVDAGSDIGFDILAGATPTAFASLRVADVTGLYRVNLQSGAATLVSTIGDGSDEIVGLAAGLDNDLIIWNNGDGSDTIDGGLGNDTVQVNGSDAAGDAFDVSAGADGRLLFRRTNLGQFSLDIGSAEVLELNGLGGDDTMVVNDLTGVVGLQRIVADLGDGDDRIDASALGVPIPVIANGGDGNDSLVGGPGDDTLDGGAGNNLIVGNAGRNTVSNGRVNPADYDGDGITDYSTYTPGTAGNPGLFEVRLSTTGETISRRLGGPGAFPIAGDYDGDGLTDFAVYEFDTQADAGRFTIVQSSDGTTRIVDFGGEADFPIAGDYDGDGRTDIAVYGFSPQDGFSRYGIIPSGTDEGIRVDFGGEDDFPVAGDFDGDGRTDIAVYGFSPQDGFSRYGIVPSSQNPTYTTGQAPVGGFPVDFGGGEDIPVGGDYDGDGITDIAVYGFSPQDDANRFAIVLSAGDPFTAARGNSGPSRAVPFGGEGDQPVGGDYTSDGITDLAVFGPGTDGVASRFLVRPSGTDGDADDIVTPFGGLNSRALPLSSSFFSAVPDDPAGGEGTGTAARTASRVHEEAIEALLRDAIPDDLRA